ncbi:pyridoxal phosphate-dependent decarboxylase family protein [Prochlorococcus sp. MIT 1223]|uniref:pyridoxal phosphate-dependent decarboxylase family protein n=1 Tax=Prochlorococcus sp. MIT 1223 TaxID=3096217 RepID=UPI002A750DE5|nr:pyridoxal-dependent decarboxylase [Prochlorococcus sp. MIT 1223]
MEPFASPDQLDSELRSFLDDTCSELCNWFAATGKSSPLPVSKKNVEVAPLYEGFSRQDLLEDLKIIMAGAYRPSHPGALAHLDPPPLTSSIVADLVCAGLNNNLLAHELSPSFSKLERNVCKWIADQFDFPSSSGGVLASGGTISNLMALVIARKKAGLQTDAKAVILASSDAHISLLKSIGVMGLSRESFVKVSTNNDGQISIDSLRIELNKLREKGQKCFAVVATAGTTIRGAIDPLLEMSRFCKSEGLWLHVDGAIGGVFGLVDSTSSLVKGISLANSLSINPQKLLGVAKTSSLLLVADRADLMSTFGTEMPYIEPSIGDDFHGGEAGLQGTRPADVLKLWMGLRQLGEKGIESLLQNAIDRRRYLQTLIDESNFEIASGPLHLIALTPKKLDKELSSSWSIKTRKDLLDNNFMVSRPLYKERYYLKIVLGNPHTSKTHLNELSEILNQSLFK